MKHSDEPKSLDGKSTSEPKEITKTNVDHTASLDDSSSQASIRGKRKRFEQTMSEELSEFREDMKEMVKTMVANCDEQMKKLYPILQGIQASNASIEASMSFLAQQNEELKKRIETMELELKKKDERIILLEDRVEDIGRTNRHRSLEIKNVRLDNKETKEELIVMTEKLAKDLNINVDRSNICDIYKTKTKADHKTIIVEFNSTIIKESFLKSARIYNRKNTSNQLSAKNLGIKKDPNESIFIAEHLTPKASRLYFLARDVKRTKNYKYCWTSFGRVYLRQEDDSPIILINNEAQVHKLKIG